MTKKKGTKKPKPTAVSFDSKTASSRPFSAMRTIIPATKPPSRTSRPSSLASRTRPKTSTTVIRTASWLLASKVRSSAGQPRQASRTEVSARTRAIADEAIRITASCSGCLAESTRVISRIGPNSPTPPAASRKVPNLVFSSPLSRRIGIRVPIAVVAIAEPV